MVKDEHFMTLKHEKAQMVYSGRGYEFPWHFFLKQMFIFNIYVIFFDLFLPL